ncbi:MAG: hypothetical protein AB1726_10235 [Planctomycetota bacterium]
MNDQRAGEEGQLVRRILEDLAWRQIAAINILGHCLKHVRDLDTKLRMATELDLSLRLFRESRELHRQLGWEDLERAVRDHEERIPYPQSRLEFGVAFHVLGVAEKVAMQSYVESTFADFAALARTYVDAAQGRPEPNRFVEYASDPTNRPQAQQFLNRWVEIALESFGSPGSPGDRRAVELGLRSRSGAEMRGAFLAEIESFVHRCGLVLPAATSQPPAAGA